ncbi:caspase family protein [uncultured Tateyamaria sp.]|uniref:caspase family protein n=1 Tax=uncultured Tateyamaria sp. TaxID=455651 RepID=UPI002624A4BF|nr:caspase family protein [uncultured Tateyamaria sp.]
MLENDKAAVVVGIDHYPGRNMLYGCCKDAKRVAEQLSRNDDGTKNMEVSHHLSVDLQSVTQPSIMESIEDMFASTLKCAVLYLAGHTTINTRTDDVVLVTPDSDGRGQGISLNEIMILANDAFPRVQSSIILLDTCHSGASGDVRKTANRATSSMIGEGVTVLAASGRKQSANESNEGGVFTSLMIEALKGSAADLLGRVTPAAVYSFIDQNFGAVGQRPVYKANVSRFTSLRQCQPRIDVGHLLSLPDWFPVKATDPTKQDFYPLDERYEPNRDNVPKEMMAIPPDPKLTKIFAGLQACNRQGMVVPVDAEHMYYAAINRTGCKLTPLGKHYRNLIDKGQLLS